MLHWSLVLLLHESLFGEFIKLFPLWQLRQMNCKNDCDGLLVILGFSYSLRYSPFSMSVLLANLKQMILKWLPALNKTTTKPLVQHLVLVRYMVLIPSFSSILLTLLSNQVLSFLLFTHQFHFVPSSQGS